MNPFLSVMQNNLTSEDERFLRAVYKPQVVAVPPTDACSFLTVTPDGEIRIYGEKDKTEPDDWGTAIYLSSRDCGLSWKTHYADENTIGPASYNPKTGRFVAFSSRYGGKKDGVAKILLCDEGLDSRNVRAVTLPHPLLPWAKQPFFLASKNRWLFAGEYREKNNEKFVHVFLSDDDGETWSHQRLPHAPVFEQPPSHKGPRWQDYSCEPTLAELPDGRVWMLVRTSQNYYYEYYSSDGGETWTAPAPSRFHGTLTMPVLKNLSDGGIVLFFCNTQPLPELDKQTVRPELSPDEKSGVWEDVFTNRDANHLAVSDDGGETWYGFRELFLNPLRNYADFRSIGGRDSRDKSVHQAEILELPLNKLLVSFGQNAAARKVVLLDRDWLKETARKEDFREGLCNVSTQVYVKSVLGGLRHFSGHCAYNRTNGALLMPDPDINFEEALQVRRTDDSSLVYPKQGVVWNFPAGKRGKVKVKFMIVGEGISFALTDRWFNPVDETVREEAFFFARLSGETLEKRVWHIAEAAFDTKEKTVAFSIDGVPASKTVSTVDAPNGLCYLHLQTLAEQKDEDGTFVKTLEKTEW